MSVSPGNMTIRRKRRGVGREKHERASSDAPTIGGASRPVTG